MPRLLQVLLFGVLIAPVALAEASAPPAIILASTYSESLDVTRYLVSEKLDGVRALWDGEVLRFRSGRIVPAPAWFTSTLPKVALDGELWIGRGQFDRLSGIVRQIPPSDDAWRAVRFMVFELPGAGGTFVERSEQLGEIVQAANVPWLLKIQQEFPVDRSYLERRLAITVALGGEGLMLHRADAYYITGRSDALVKMKPLQDGEALVVGYVAGKGKHAGRLGALLLETERGQRFKVGTGLSDVLRDNPPTIGSRVTYRFRGLTSSGLPRFPSYWRIYDE